MFRYLWVNYAQIWERLARFWGEEKGEGERDGANHQQDIHSQAVNEACSEGTKATFQSDSRGKALLLATAGTPTDQCKSQTLTLGLCFWSGKCCEGKGIHGFLQHKHFHRVQNEPGPKEKVKLGEESKTLLFNL